MTKIDAKALDSPEHLLKQECYCIDLGSECAYCTAIKEVTSIRAMVKELEHQKRRLQGKVEDLAHSMKSLEARQVTREQLAKAAGCVQGEPDCEDPLFDMASILGLEIVNGCDND